MKQITNKYTHFMRRPIKHFTIVASMAVAIGLTGCDPGLPKGASDDLKINGFAEALTQNEFNALPPEQQYQVASKIYGTLFRGISAEDFFSLDQGITTLQPKSNDFLNETRQLLKNTLSNDELLEVNTLIEGLDEEGNPNEEDAKYSFDQDSDIDENEKAVQIPLARIKEYPISRDFYIQWMAYFLSNTIMYSPAIEMESTDTIDAQNMNRFLTAELKKGSSIRDMVRSNLPSLARWRVSRSSENHALEGYELYLGLFETEEDSVKGGVACKDFYLTDDSAGYVISTTNTPNTEPQLILDSFFITTCSDLYDVIAGHPLILPRAIEVLTNYFFSGRSRDDRVNIIESVKNAGPETYEEIFTALLFSKEYLLNTERPKSFEENLMPLLDRLKWSPEATQGSIGKRIFEFMASGTENPNGEGSGGGNILFLGNKGWQSMSLKIGRLPDVPLDALSFANYHKAIREQLLLNETSYDGSRLDIPGLIYIGDGDDADENLRDVVAQLDLIDYVHFLYLNVLHRKASAEEISGLIEIYDNLGYVQLDTNGDQAFIPNTNNNRHNDISDVTFDYISRLPEFYYFKAIN